MFVRRIAYISLATQTLLATIVIAFSAWQLNRCPVVEKVSDSGEVDTAACPARALYSTMLTSTLAYFFPSPLSSLIEASYANNQRQQNERSSDKPTKAPSTRKRTRSQKTTPETEDELK